MSLASIQAKFNERMEKRQKLGPVSPIIMPALSKADSSYYGYCQDKFTDYFKMKAQVGKAGRQKFPGKDLF